MTGDFKKAHAHTLGMVVAAVHGIDYQLKCRLAWAKYHIANSYMNAIVESISQGMMAVNEFGVITHMFKTNWAFQMNGGPFKF